MVTAKEHIAEIIKRQPDDSTYDDIIRRVWYIAYTVLTVAGG